MSSCPRCADRLKNSGCWYFNKLINNYEHLQAHLSMFSVSVEIFPARMSCSIHCLFVRNLLIGFHKHVEVIFIRPSFLQVCRRNERYWQRLIKPCCCFNSHNAGHNSQVAQRYVSIVAHTRHRSPSFFDKAGKRLGVFSFHRLYICISVYPW